MNVYILLKFSVCTYISPAKSSQVVKLTNRLYPVLRSRMRGAIPPLAQHVFMMWHLSKGTILPLPYS
jgi:hypothetical protein